MISPRLSKDRTHIISTCLNGKNRTGPAEPRMLLTDWLRQQLGATGTHVGCEHGVCGACTVQIDGVAQRGCLTLAVQVDGRRIDTVEGLADAEGHLNDLQAAFKRHHALQCGFCTPGILMSCSDWLQRITDRVPSETALREMLSGHICRCTGYTPIVAAILEVANARHQARQASGQTPNPFVTSAERSHA